MSKYIRNLGEAQLKQYKDEEVYGLIKWHSSAISLDGKVLCSGDFKGNFKQWNIIEGGILELAHDYKKVISGSIRTIMITNDSKFCYVADRYGGLRKINLVEKTVPKYNIDLNVPFYKKGFVNNRGQRGNQRGNMRGGKNGRPQEISELNHRKLSDTLMVMVSSKDGLTMWMGDK